MCGSRPCPRRTTWWRTLRAREAALRVCRAALLGAAFLASAAPSTRATPPLELVESFPIETILDNPDLQETHEVWLEMIESASSSLDFAEFYASNTPGSRLEPIILAIEEAARRGVRVRFLSENNFYSIYPQTLDRLAHQTNITVRRDSTSAAQGGVLHAKYFVVDGREAFVGSQNFDWRALEHIQELGLRVRVPHVVAWLAAVFESDWRRAGGATSEAPPPPQPLTRTLDAGDTRVTPVFSPQGRTLRDELWDLPRIVERIDRAENTVRVQLLTYRAVDRDDRYFAELETALRSAAARGVQVQLLLADWCKRNGTIEGLQSLQCLPNVDVKLMSIPEWSGGFIPFARVAHAKYLVVDGRAAWLGTSNWERNYFYGSRNVGVIVDGGDIPRRLDAYFENGWSSPYAERVDPAAVYTAPRIRE